MSGAAILFYGGVTAFALFALYLAYRKEHK
jgi:hypothetical protein